LRSAMAACISKWKQWRWVGTFPHGSVGSRSRLLSAYPEIRCSPSSDALGRRSNIAAGAIEPLPQLWCCGTQSWGWCRGCMLRSFWKCRDGMEAIRPSASSWYLWGRVAGMPDSGRRIHGRRGSFRNNGRRNDFLGWRWRRVRCPSIWSKRMEPDRGKDLRRIQAEAQPRAPL